MNSYANNVVRSRRDWLKSSGCGFGSLALGSMLAEQKAQAAPAVDHSLRARTPLLPARAKRVIFIFMQGGPSHVDTFDYKPDLIARDGKTIDFTGVRFNSFGKVSQRTLMKPLWKFRQYGNCGQHVSELFPEIAKHVDDLCFLKGMHTEGVAHGPSTLFMHTGATNLVRPSLGSWLMYGLGTENQSLPGFVQLQPSDTKGGPRNYSNAFLPSVYQGTAIGRASRSIDQMTIDHIRNPVLNDAETESRFRLTQQLNQAQLQRRTEQDDRLEAVIKSYELAWRMQNKAPGILDLSEETATTQEMYGIGSKPTDAFGRQCLMARRLSESGVRFVQINYADESPNPRWDQHSNMPKHMEHATATDKPVAGLLADLKQRGLLEDTLVWWGAEFGRTPFNQSNDGRDHNPRGFTVFLAGGGVKKGFSYGSTDEIGHEAVDGKVHMHDLHATVLHALGLDHEQLTYRYAGRDFRLTDVFGRVVKDIFA
ncbi:DUF1501 domain-containing protein [Fuerstiella marisgermanici]|uniref:Sulfatase n=1 Tax=Fuerstiella marisgermanici TaxID=1891926 RepID=A0A1P8WL08_9PLAN|nr:DUF1501 domain-containing protein [Fuerstiella marisgermanici]APZ94750.1 hypothetical protein Fuma_04389 [Fuerstiella marisgermanici]